MATLFTGKLSGESRAKRAGLAAAPAADAQSSAG
jgi:hypothetical protein